MSSPFTPHEMAQLDQVATARVQREDFEAAHPELRDENLNPLFADILSAHARAAVVTADAMARATRWRVVFSTASCRYLVRRGDDEILTAHNGVPLSFLSSASAQGAANEANGGRA